MRLLSACLLLLSLGCARTSEFIGRIPQAQPDAGATIPEWNCGPRCFRDPGIPAPPEGPFTGAPDPAVPALVYPLAGSLHPINLAPPEFQWRCDGAREKTYRIRLTAAAEPARRYDFYVPCRPPPDIPTPAPIDQCTYPLPARVWRAVADENRDAEVIVTVEAADRQRGTVASSAMMRIAFSPEPLDAGIYYFAREGTGPAVGRIKRALAGGGAAQDFLLPMTGSNRFACAGCHAVSRDGRTLAFTVSDRNGFFSTVRVEAPSPPLVAPPDPPQIDAATMAVNADGSLALVSHDGPGGNGQLVVRETATGKEIKRLDPPGGRKVFFPDWSRQGQIVATLATREENAWTVLNGDIVVFPFDGVGFGPMRTVVAGDAALFHFYPSWSPDGDWIVFVSAPAGGSSYHNAQARLRLVSSDGARLVELGRAVHEPGKAATWPRFAPVSQAGGKLLFISFDSNMDYGYLLKNGIDPLGGWPQLWLAAVDLRKLPAAPAVGDPSSAPVWLPFQDPRLASVLGAWTERLVCGERSPCGAGASCDAGRCVPAAP